MRTKLAPKAVVLVLACGMACATASVHAQASFAEPFDSIGPTLSGQDGPSGLIARGWIFRNQSQPRGTSAWYAPNPAGSGIPPQQGTGYMGIEGTVAQPGGFIGDWAILPVIPGQAAGDTVRFFVQGRESSSFAADEVIELRYSPSGGTGTGSAASSVGDFTVVLGSRTPRLYIWDAIEATVPGPGRLAIRYTKPTAFTMGGYCYARVDNLTVTGQPPHPPVPEPGQAVHWTLAMSPVTVDSNTYIPAGGTLVIDPGVVVNVRDNVRFHISGRLEVAGTAAARVRLVGENNHAQMALTGGDLDARFTDFDLQLGGDVGTFNNEGVHPAAAVFADCTFGPWAWVHLYTSYTQMDRCSFNTTYGPIIASPARLTDVTSNRTVAFSHGIYVLNNVTVSGATGQSELDGSGFNITSNAQGCLVDGISALNNSRAGVFATGGNFFISPGNTIQGNAVALELIGAGLYQGSVLPPAGNGANGLISVGHIAPPEFGGSNIADYVWEDIGLPYIVGNHFTAVPGVRRWTIREGVDVLLGLNAQITTLEFGQVFVEGRPGAPVTMAPLVPGQPWHSLAYATTGNRVTDLNLSGSLRGISTFLGTYVDVLNSHIHGNEHGGVRGVRARKSIFSDNTVAGISNINGDIGSGVPDAWGQTNPNIFENNGHAIIDYYLGSHGTIGAEHNWWNSPTGPQSDDNPGGQGERVFGSVDTQPFRTARPDTSDHPPVIELSPIDYIEPLKKVTLHWTASDDQGIVSQRIAHRLGTDFDRGFTVVAELPPGQRSYEWTPPEVGFTNAGPTTFIRVVARDTAGQDGYAQLESYIPDQVRPGFVEMTPSLAGRTFRPQEIIPIQVNWGGFDEFITAGPDLILELLNDDHTDYMSATFTPGSPLSEIRAPGVSTDQARLVAISHGTYNRAKFFFSEPFSIRPDPRLGDAPPSITLLSPQPGAHLAAGSTVPISWAAADDKEVRWAKIYISYDAGRTWQRLAERLPGPSGSFPWIVAPGTGYIDVRVRVVAVDSRFQNTSATATVSIGQGPALCNANCDGSTVPPILTANDFTCFLNKYAAGDPYANCDGSTQAPMLNANDFICFLNAYAAGCP